ncbi:hypothetical protein MBLNU230_g3562t1 [Neophaeotheca triangularis]
MKPTTILPFLASTLVTGQEDYSPFTLTTLTTHQPNGYPGGNVNYYRIGFNIASTDAATNTTSRAYCNRFWGDNNRDETAAYSLGVPTGQWIQCDSSEQNLGDGASDFSFQLFPYFSIGNFSLEVRRTISTQNLLTAHTHLTNTTQPTPALTCQINPQQVPSSSVHASGDCNLVSPHLLPAKPSTPGPCTPPSSPNHPITFPVQKATLPAQSIYLTGSHPLLGSWEPAAAVPLTETGSWQSYPLWNGTVELPRGQRVEYKFLLKTADGAWEWECCENRILEVPRLGEGGCGPLAAGGQGVVEFFRG